MRGTYLLSGLLAAVLVVAASPAAAEPARVIEPQKGGRYPLLSLLQGTCFPEKELPRPQGRESKAQATSTSSDFYAQDDDAIRYGSYRPTHNTKDGGGGSTESRPCAWSTSDNTVKLGGETALIARYAGTTRMELVRTTRFYVGCSAEDDADPGCGEAGIGWYDDPDRSPVPEKRAFTFEIYDSCTYTVTSVKGNAFTNRVGSSKKVAVRSATALEGGQTLVVERGASLTIVNGSGFEVTVRGPGETYLEERKICTNRFTNQLPPGQSLPTEPPAPKVKDGWTRAKEFFGISPEVEAGRQTYEGIFSNVAPRMAARRAPVEFTVQRNQRKRTTTACAKYGQVRITHLASSVPKGRRVLVVPAGGCAVTVDGRASRIR